MDAGDVSLLGQHVDLVDETVSPLLSMIRRGRVAVALEVLRDTLFEVPPGLRGRWHGHW